MDFLAVHLTEKAHPAGIGSYWDASIPPMGFVYIDIANVYT